MCTALLAGASVAVAAPGAMGDELSYGAKTPHGGKTLTGWAVAHGKWAVQHDQPADVKGCSDLPQPSAPTRFLPLVVGKATVRCTFPAGSAIVFPAGANYCSPDAKTPVSKLRKTCDAGASQIASVALTVDGTPVTGLMADYRVLTPVFTATFPAKNGFGVKAGPSKLVVAGWYVLLRPLAAGEHTLIGTLKIKKGPTFVGTYRITIR
jgi:hypothetical protein